MGLTVLVALNSGARAGETVKVGGSHTRFATTIDSRVEDKSVQMVLTGTALRRKYGLNVYSIASYIQEGASVRDAEGLARVCVVKQLHLVFERDVDGETMARSFRDSIGMNHPAPEFAVELARLEHYFRAHPVRAGDHIWLTSIPHSGLWCQHVGQAGLLIPSENFAHAAWEVYLGRHNLGMPIKTGLSSRL
jgi:hypothetical protein